MIVPLCGLARVRRQNVGMARRVTKIRNAKARHYVKQWGNHRGLTQEALGELIGVAHGAIGQLERGETNYTQETMEAIAEAPRCSVADLIAWDPSDKESFWSVVDPIMKLPPDQRTKILASMKLLSGSREAA